jgi:hypothetical protein
LHERLIGYAVFSGDEPPFAIIRKSMRVMYHRPEVIFVMKCLIQACLQSGLADRPSFNDLEIVSGPDPEAASGYVCGISD